QHLLVKHHLQRTAMHGILGPVVTRLGPAHFGVDVVAVEADERPLPRRQADAVEVVRTYAEVVEFAHGIGLQVDADTQRAQFTYGVENDAGNAYLVQRKGHRKAADASTGNQDW